MDKKKCQEQENRNFESSPGDTTVEIMSDNILAQATKLELAQ